MILSIWYHVNTRRLNLKQRLRRGKSLHSNFNCGVNFNLEGHWWLIIYSLTISPETIPLMKECWWFPHGKKLSHVVLLINLMHILFIMHFFFFTSFFCVFFMGFYFEQNEVEAKSVAAWTHTQPATTQSGPIYRSSSEILHSNYCNSSQNFVEPKTPLSECGKVH